MARYKRLLLIGLIVALLGFIGVALISDLSQLPKYIMAFPWLLMLPVLGLRMINWALRFIKWHFYLYLVGLKNIRPFESALVFIAGFPMAVSPGKVAEILKCFILKSLTGTPIETTLPVVMAERLSDGSAVLILIAWSIVNLAAAQYWPVFYIAIAVQAIGILILQSRPLCRALLKWISSLPIVGRFGHSLELLYESSYQIVQLRNLVFAVSLGTFANILDGLGVYLILVGIGQPATSDTFFKALLAISLSVVAGSLSGLPSGIGASDLTISGTLLALFPNQITPSQVGFMTLLARFVQSWWGVLIGGLAAFIFRDRLFRPDLAQIIEVYDDQQQQIANSSVQKRLAPIPIEAEEIHPAQQL